MTNIPMHFSSLVEQGALGACNSTDYGDLNKTNHYESTNLAKFPHQHGSVNWLLF